MDEMNSDLVKALLSLAGALFGAYVGSRFALSKTKSERRWQAKHEAYSKILGAVEDMRFWAEESYASNLGLPSVSPEKLSQLSTQYQDAKLELWTFVHIGELVISPRATEKLENLMTQISREEFRFEDDPVDDSEYPIALATHCERVRAAIRDTMPDLVLLARRDLR